MQVLFNWGFAGGEVAIANRVSKLVALLIAAWCVMTFVHESGHILCGWASGGTLTAVDLLPWHLPYSVFQPDPHPLVTLWGGLILGVVIPSSCALVIRTDWAWFIAHFCTLANGAYIATAWATRDGYLDTTKLLEHGAHPASIAVYCVVTIAVGYIGFRRQCVLVLSPPVARDLEKASDNQVLTSNLEASPESQRQDARADQEQG